MGKNSNSSNQIATFDNQNFNNEDSNNSLNASFDSVLQARLSRRKIMLGGLGGVATTLVAAVGGAGLTACGGGGGGSPLPTQKQDLLGFDAVAKTLADQVTLPLGYSYSVLFALGDTMRSATPGYKNDGHDGDFEHRAGDHHDGMEWFGLDAKGQPSLSSIERGLLAINFEATTNHQLSSFFIHADGGTNTLPRPAAEVDKELAIHGIGIIEVQKEAKKWRTVNHSGFNFRLTPMSEIAISGPAKGNRLMVTKYAPTGEVTRGTLNNCGTGKTPWNSFLTGEENWAGYFFRAADDNTARANDKSVVALERYGRKQGAASRHGWESAGGDDKYRRWNNSKTGDSTDGSDDYRNEMNGQGFIVEIDPFNASVTAKKRTGLGRFAHESAAFGTPVNGQSLAVYMGDDSRNEYIYKFVSTALWNSADANPDPKNRLAVGDKYLDDGKLYVAKFNADGLGQWIELSLQNPAIQGYSKYSFADYADICVNARLAADAVGATKMDRPEWCSTNVKNGEIYFTLTNNSNRSAAPNGSSQLAPDSANPRAYTDEKDGKPQNGNPNGHILRIREAGQANNATEFSWDIYAFGAQSDADTGLVNLSNLTSEQDFSSPDGLAFTPSTGIMWIQTDDGAYTDVTNCMMLAALPGKVGDGMKKSLLYTASNGVVTQVDTYVGQVPEASNLKRFLVGPKGSEITGICETPDGRALFINIQHPGEATSPAILADSTQYQSQWPSNAGYGAGSRPRSATIVITKDDGGRIGS